LPAPLTSPRTRCEKQSTFGSLTPHPFLRWPLYSHTLYDLNGNRTTIGYPGGVEATYGYDFADRQTTLSVTTPSVPTPATAVVTGAAYLPSGPLSSLAFGNGASETRGFDGRYLPATITLTAPRNRSWTYTTDGVGNITQIVSTGDCAGDTVLTSHDVTNTEDYESCAALEAGPDVTVTSTGALDLAAASRVVLRGGVSVEAGGTLAVRIDPALSGNVTKTYGYQDYDYFLTSADGPWGSQSWNYDKIGNRTSETDNGRTDDYSYTANGAGGNTALLSSISLALGNSRDFDYTPAGHQTEVSASGNVVTFEYDDAGRLNQASRTGGATCPFVYDGRGFLRQAGTLSTTTGTVVPTYDSSGLLRALLKQPSATDPERRYHVFYLAGRPVAQLATETGASDRWWYLTTDHLGTPLIATDAAGVELWDNRFEPFGEDAAGQALAAEMFLRFPGQWDDETWGEATLGVGVADNVYRWYQPSFGRYSRPDPTLTSALQSLGFQYAISSPVSLSDQKGLQALPVPPPAPPVSPLPLPRLLPPPPPVCSPSPVVGSGAAAATIVGVALAIVFTPRTLAGPGIDDFTDPSCDPQCGDCDPGEHGFLQYAVDQACKGSRRACGAGMSPRELEDNLRRNVQCYYARQEINQRCFRGGDEGHRTALRETQRAIYTCLDLLTGP